MAVTSYGRNKNRDDEIKKTKRRPIIAPAIAVRLLKKTDRTNIIATNFVLEQLTNMVNQRRANRSQTTGEPLVLSVVSYGLRSSA